MDRILFAAFCPGKDRSTKPKGGNLSCGHVSVTSSSYSSVPSELPLVYSTPR